MASFEIILLILAITLSGCVVARHAILKGKSALGWFIFGVLFPIISLIIVSMIKSEEHLINRNFNKNSSEIKKKKASVFRIISSKIYDTKNYKKSNNVKRLKYVFLILFFLGFALFLGLFENGTNLLKNEKAVPLSNKFETIVEEKKDISEQYNFSKYVDQLKSNDTKIRNIALNNIDTVSHNFKLSNANVIELVIALLKDPDRDCRHYATRILLRVDDTRKIDPLIEVSLKDPDINIRSSASYALKNIDGSVLYDKIVAYINDEDPKIRDRAFQILSKIKDPRVADTLTGHLESLFSCLNGKTCVGDLRANAAKALGDLNDPRAAPQLNANLKSHIFSVASNSAYSLRRLGLPPKDINDYVAYLILLKDLDGIVKLGDQAIPAIIQYVEEKNIDYIFGIEALGEFKDPRSKKALVRCLLKTPKDDYAHVKLRDKAIAKSIEKIGDNTITEELMNALSYYNKIGFEGSEIITMLGTIKDPRSFSTIIKCLDNQNPLVRKSALKALGNWRNSQAITQIVKIMPDWEARVELREALEKLRWVPEILKEKVYWWIAGAEIEEINKNWPKVRSVLMTDLNTENRQKRKHALCAFISVGKEEIIAELIKILEIKREKFIAEIFLNSGNIKLKETAELWAKKNGYMIYPNFYSEPAASWGKP